MSKILYGKPVAEAIYAEIDRFVSDGNKIKLYAIGGNNEQWQQYVGSLTKSCAAHGVELLRDDMTEYNADDFAECLAKAIDAGVDGVLCEQPLPAHMKKFVETIPEKLDIDCVTDKQIAKLYRGDEGMRPATAQAVAELLDYYGIDVYGKHVVIVGRGSAVGKPLAFMLLQRNATVTVCHSKTADLAEKCRHADILVSATGRHGLITADFVTGNTVAIDVGLSFVDGKTCGDLSEEACEKCAAYSPVPGGIGPVTRATLLANLVKAAQTK